MAGLIEAEKIAANRYATPEAADITLYKFNGCEGLTLGQLVNAVCCRVGAALEDQSVVKTNIITDGTNRLNAFSSIVSGFMDGSVDYDTELKTAGYEGRRVREFLEEEGFTITTEDKTPTGHLPKEVTTPNDRLLAYEVLKDKLEKLANLSQQDMIDLQTDISRRDVAFSTAVNVVRTLGGALQNTAGNF